MNLDKLFNDYPEFETYLKDNNISKLEEITFSDILLNVKDKKNQSGLINLYLKLRKSNINFNVNINKIDRVFDNKNINYNNKVTKLKDIKSIWSKQYEIDEGINMKSIVSLIISFLSYNDLNKNNGKILDDYLFSNGVIINSKIRFELRKVIEYKFDKVIIFNNMIRCKDINRSRYNFDQYKRLISNRNKNLYLCSFLSVKAYTYLRKMNIYTFSDIFIKLNIDDYNKLYFNLINTIPILKETNNNNIPCDYIIEEVIRKNNLFDELVITNMRVKGMNDNEIENYKNVNYKTILKSYYSILDFLKSYFDSYNGRYFIMYLLCIEDGYISLSVLKKMFPKYFNLLLDIIEKGFIYQIYYYSEYGIITNRKLDDERRIFEKYGHNIDNNEYMQLSYEIIDNLKNSGLNLPLDKVNERIKLIYKYKNGIYSKGYISLQYKVYKVYNEFFSKGVCLNELNDFQEKYNMFFDDKENILDKKTHYFVINNNRYVLKKRITNKYGKELNLYDENLMIVMRICESMKSMFDVSDVSIESNLDERYVKNILSKSKMYYQLSYKRFIKSDDLIIDNDLVNLFVKYKHYSSDDLYKIINEKYPSFLRNYKIKSKTILQRIVRRVISNKVKILALYK